MNDAELEQRIRDAAVRVCTDKELEAVDLVWGQHLSIRRAAATLGVSKSTLTDRLENARRKINREMGRRAV